MSGSNNLQVGHWTEDPDQCQDFLTEVESRIVRVSKYVSYRYQVGTYQEDILLEIETELLQQMHDKKTPFDEASSKEAADFFLKKKNYWILKLGRSIARRIAGRQSKEQPTQAEILADIPMKELLPDRVTELRAIAASLLRFESLIPDLTSRERDIFGKETLRRADIDDLPPRILDEVAQIAGISGSELRAYNKNHDEQGRNSDSDRRAYSRAKAKVEKVFPKEERKTRAKRAKIISLLVIVLSLALPNCISLGRSNHQNDIADQGNFRYKNARVQQGNFKHQNARMQQSIKSRENARIHQVG